MDKIKIPDSKMLIPSNMFDICHIDKLTRKDISLKYTKYEAVPHRKSCYFLDKFIFHIKTHFNIEIKEYCKKYLNIEWPRCPISGKEVGYKIFGKGLVLSIFAVPVTKEYSPAFKEYCERISKERIGAGNPMFGKKAWNTGLTAETNETVRKVAQCRVGVKTPDDVREKQSISAKKRKIHGHTGIKHSEATKQILREKTAQRYSNGIFKRESSIHIKMREFLNSLPLLERLGEEQCVQFFSIDFAFPDVKIGIECNGTYFHVDPRIYPNGPKDAIQRRNFGRDKIKLDFLLKEGWKILSIWETEINDQTFKEELICKLKELNILKV